MGNTQFASESATHAAHEQYRVADLRLYPAGNNLVLVHAKRNENDRFLRQEVVDLLLWCDEFRTLDGHLSSYCREHRTGPAMTRVLRKELQKAARAGHLVSLSAVRRALQKPSGLAAPPTISCVGFPTRDRVRSLQKSMASYIESACRHDRRPNYVVTDDSRHPDTRRACREMLKALQAHYGVNISYAGIEEKLAYIAKLAVSGNIPEHVLRFGCVGNEQHGLTTVGANRNALLLHTVGELTLSADDDTLCQVAAAPAQRGGLAFSSEKDPLEAWFYPDRATALQAVGYAKESILTLHERWLGRELQSALSSPGSDFEISLAKASPLLLHELQEVPAKVRVTANGSVGDCAWDDPHYHFFKQPATLRRLTKFAQVHQPAVIGREMVQAVNQTTISDTANPVFAMCIGLDNREILPPFMPVDRAEEVAFGATISKCFAGNYISHLPWVLPHVPSEPRSFSRGPVFSIGPRTLVLSGIETFDRMPGKSPGEQLLELGEHLKEIGRLPPAILEESIRSAILSSMSATITELESRSQEGHEFASSFWRREMRTFTGSMRRDAVAPVDQLYELHGGKEETQSLVFQYGELLSWWPVVVETARDLRAEGRRLAQPV